MTDRRFKITSYAALQGHFHSYSETFRETLVLPSNMFLFVNFDYIHYYLAMDSGTQLFDPLFCCDKESLSAFNMSVGAKQIIRGDGCCSALTQEWTGLKRPKSPDLALLSSHGENPLSLSHINSQTEQRYRPLPPAWCLTLFVFKSVSPPLCLWSPEGSSLTRWRRKTKCSKYKIAQSLNVLSLTTIISHPPTHTPT